MGDWSDNLEYEHREYYGHFYDTDEDVHEDTGEEEIEETTKVKLIIEIPKVYYVALSKTEEIISSQRNGKTLMSVIYSAVANGTPFDDVKAEIKEKSVWYRGQTYDGLCIALKILDNIGKAESEDK